MKYNRILTGNNIETLKTIPDCSADCCVTSPPYYGLRDYGTAKWTGGDPACNHFRDNKIVNGVTYSGDTRPKGDMIYKKVCKKCGAVREDNQIGLEGTPEEYIEKLLTVFKEVKRVLRNDGTLWIVIGDVYAGSMKGGAKYPENAGNFKRGTNRGMIGQSGCNNVSRGECKNKDLAGIPWTLAFALRADGWYLRQDIIWHKTNPMPESVTDRCTKSHEYIFLLSKSPRYYFDSDAVKEPAVKNSYLTRNKRDVWTVSTEPNTYAHFAMFPEELITPVY